MGLLVLLFAFHFCYLRAVLLKDEVQDQAMALFDPGNFDQLISQADQVAVEMQEVLPDGNGFGGAFLPQTQTVSETTLLNGPQAYVTKVVSIKTTGPITPDYKGEVEQVGTKWTNFPKIEGPIPPKKENVVVMSKKMVYEPRKSMPLGNPDERVPPKKPEYEEIGGDFKGEEKPKTVNITVGDISKKAVMAMDDATLMKRTGLPRAAHMTRLQAAEHIDDLMKEADNLKKELDLAQETTNSASMKENQRLLNLYGKLKMQMHDALMSYTPPDIFNEGYPKPAKKLDVATLAGTWVPPGSLPKRGTPPSNHPLYPPFNKQRDGDIADDWLNNPNPSQGFKAAPDGTDIVTGPLKNPQRPNIVGKIPKPVPYH